MLRPLRISLAALALAAVPALAVLASAPGSADAAVASTAAPLISGNTTPLSGYITANLTGSDIEARASWVQPAGTCTSANTAASFWVVVGNGPPAIARIGTDTDCSGGSPVYSAWYATDMNSRVSVNMSGQLGGNPPINAGDTMTALVGCVGATCSFLIQDQTADSFAVPVNQTLSGTPQSAEAIISGTSNSSSSSGGLQPLTNFGTVNFSQVKFNNQAASALNPNKLVIATIGGSGRNLDTISELGTDPSRTYSYFSGTWVSAS